MFGYPGLDCSWACFVPYGGYNTPGIYLSIFILFFFFLTLQGGSRAGSDPASFREINTFFFPPLIVLDSLLLSIPIQTFLRSNLVHMGNGKVGTW